MSGAAVTSGRDGVPARDGGRRWYAVAGAVLVVAGLVPPLAVLARRYVYAESLQFLVFAMVAPALITMGAPWRLLRLSAAADRLAAVRQRQRSFPRAAGFLLLFMAVALVWRLPPVMDALPRQPLLVAAELVTVLPAGLGLWLELAASPPLAPRLPNPHRAAVAALAMWSTWAVAYALGFASHGVFHGYDPAGGALGAVADQEITVGLVWAVSAACFIPVVAVTMLAWLKDNDTPDEELQRPARDERQRPVVRGWERKPRRGGATPG